MNKLTNFYCADPLEQFDVFMLWPSITYSLTNLTLFAILNLSVMGLILYTTTYANQSHTTAPSVISDITRSIYEMLADLSENNIRLSRQVYFPILFFVFLLILITNLVGMIPYSYTVTSSFIWTFYVSLALFIGINLLGIYQHGYAYFSFGLPAGSPLALAPLIATVEFISYFSRVISLSVRLFANMMAGHTLLKILIGFSWVMLNSKAILIIFAALPWIVVVAIMGLEFVISMLQAYVFVTLISLYINDMVIGH